MRRSSGLVVAAVIAIITTAVVAFFASGSATTASVEERRVLNNDRVYVYEYVFPAGFRGEEHAAVADEFAYVLEGEFTVVTRGHGKQVVRRCEI